MRVAALIFSLIAATSASAEYIPGSGYSYKNWEGAAYTDGQNGAFSHCVVSAAYKSGDTLLLSLTRDKSLVVSVTNDNFSFEVGTSLPVTIYIDRRRPIYARANPLSSKQVVLSLPNFDQSMYYIQMGRTMEIEGRQFSGAYDLTGTKVALDRTYDCAARHYDYAAIPSQTEGLDKTALFQIATNMITSINASDATYLNASEIEKMGFGKNSVFWASKDFDLVAGTLTAHRPSMDLRATDSQDIAFISDFCDGDFASSIQKVSHIEGVNQRELHGICRENEQDTHVIATKTDIGEHTLYNIVFFFDSEKTGEIKRDEVSGNIAIHAASYAKK